VNFASLGSVEGVVVGPDMSGPWRRLLNREWHVEGTILADAAFSGGSCGLRLDDTWNALGAS
jgi:hypothetical protein